MFAPKINKKSVKISILLENAVIWRIILTVKIVRLRRKNSSNYNGNSDDLTNVTQTRIL